MLKSAARPLSLPHYLPHVVLACAVGQNALAASNQETTARLTNCGLVFDADVTRNRKSRGAHALRPIALLKCFYPYVSPRHTLKSSRSLALGIAGHTQDHYYTQKIERSASIDEGTARP